MTAPERMCAPTSEPFSTTTTEISGRDLLEPDRGGKARRPGADDHDVEFHRFAGGKLGHVKLSPSMIVRLFHARRGNRTAAMLDDAINDA